MFQRLSNNKIFNRNIFRTYIYVYDDANTNGQGITTNDENACASLQSEIASFSDIWVD